MPDEITLRYGSNPHQAPARVYARTGDLAFGILNGNLGYINLLDALNSWQLVRELRQATGLTSAASFKHVSPSGAALGLPLSEQLRKAYRVEDLHCTRIACAKADLWRLRQHPATIGLPFRLGLSRPELDNGVDLYLRDDLTVKELERWEALFETAPARLTPEEKRQCLGDFRCTVLGSDGYSPFRDSIDRAVRSGVRCVVQPGGSNRDAEVIAACDERDVTMAFTGIRLFHH